MNLPAVIISQYQAAQEMLKRAIIQCPESVWNDPADKNKFWHVAYHALFYTHLYLQNSEQDFVPWSKHRDDYQKMDPHRQPYDKDAVLDYVAFCQQQVVERVPQLDWDAKSGFDWLPFGKLELQFYTIRHIQQHAGELMERLGARANIDVDWVGTGNG